MVPAAAPKPKPRAPKPSTTVSANAPRAEGRRWTTAAGATLGVLALTGLLVAVMRRPRRSAPEPLAEPTPTPASPSRPVPPAPATNGASHEPVTEELRPLELLVGAPEPEPLTPPSERCSIAWWRGYVRSQFIAYAESRDGGAIVAESPSFAWRSSKPPPQTDDALAAHTRLLEQLSELGWEAEDSGPAWFQFTFQRAPVAAPSRPEVPVG